MSHKSHVTLTDRQYRFLLDESVRTGLSMAELVRRALDVAYRKTARPRVRGFDLNLGVWRRPDAAVIGRQPLRAIRPAGRPLRDD
jgi:hypothetical protein